MIKDNNPKNQKIIDSVYQASQEQIFHYWHDLTEQQKAGFLKQIQRIDFSLLDFLVREVYQKEHPRSVENLLEPADVISLKEREQFDPQAFLAGERQLTQGKIAAVLVAGGQSTRLGYKGPKGKFPITPVRHKSLFQLHAEKILALNRKYNTIVPWYIMTSRINHQESITFFKQHRYFGLRENDIFFFQQEMIPAIDRKGKLILDAPDHIFMNPNGHGGVLKGLWDSGAIEDMKLRGISDIFYFQIDNALTRICDPVFIGYHLLHKADMSNKIVQKKYPEENLGIICRINGKLGVVEYSDLSREQMYAQIADGTLKYSAGSIAIHMISVAFIEQENRGGFKLPYHIAEKTIAHLDKKGNLVKPSHKNGIKFETFIFDALPHTNRTLSLEVAREREFSPVKNRQGEDSPATARQDLCNLYGSWLEAVGFKIPRDTDGNVIIKIEISPLYANDTETLKNKKIDLNENKDNLYLG
jgi:UDP-N-acetylglucosamine/UDP-N-acetylgalactosamine diphosphorylase